MSSTPSPEIRLPSSESGAAHSRWRDKLHAEVDVTAAVSGQVVASGCGPTDRRFDMLTGSSQYPDRCFDMLTSPGLVIYHSAAEGFGVGVAVCLQCGVVHERAAGCPECDYNPTDIQAWAKQSLGEECLSDADAN